MCGIAGLYAFAASAPAVSERELLAIREHMAPRGPDAAGDWFSADRRVALAHRRLAIIDLSADGNQPMHDGDGCSIIFNGEIYNFRALRAELEAEGIGFSTRSDTEVILRAYRAWGVAMLPRLRGMFAFALWDARRGEMLLARDTFGIKPLYYSTAGGTLRFASTVRALLAGGQISRTTDPAAQAGFYLTGSVPEPYTAYRDISAFPAGCWATVTSSGMSAPTKFASVAAIYRDTEAMAPVAMSTAEVEETARAALRDSVAHHMVADVPVGTFLSAGIDSGAILGLVRDAGINDVQAVTLAYTEYAGRHDDEAPAAARVARHYGYRQHTHTVTASEFTSDLPNIIAAMDQPTIDGINSWFIAKATRTLGLKAALSGLGGDELLGGYPSFSSIPRWVRGLSPLAPLLRGNRALARFNAAPIVARMAIPPKGLALLQFGHETNGAYLVRRGLFMPAQLASIMDPDIAREGLERLNLLDLYSQSATPACENWFARIATLENANYMRNQLLRDTDWASMAHGLEVRVPLVDVPLLRAIAPLMLRTSRPDGKTLLARAPALPLPDDIIHRRKTGFSIPFGDWAGLSGGGTAATPYRHLRDWAVQIGRGIFGEQ